MLQFKHDTNLKDFNYHWEEPSSPDRKWKTKMILMRQGVKARNGNHNIPSPS